MSVDIWGTSCDQCQSMVQYSFTSTETKRLVRTDSPGRPRHIPGGKNKPHICFCLVKGLEECFRMLAVILVSDHWEKSTSILRVVPCSAERVQRGRDSSDKGKRALQSSPLLQHQTSTDDVEQPTSQLITTENRYYNFQIRWYILIIVYFI